VLELLVPECVAWAETSEDRLVELFGVERAALGRAVEKRTREFTTGRACARLALRRLGAPVSAIPSGEHGEPRWPPGVVGSITHCERYRACAVAWSDALAGLGIDAEPDAPLPDGVLEDVAHGRELDLVSAGGGDVDVGRLLFSAKEAVYKAWFPLAGCRLGFDDVELALDLATRELHARLLVPGPVVNGSRLTEFRGRWAVEEGVICTAIVVPAGGCARPPGTS
jgi:4'-phosphopantetheinyl transferase EntD